MAGGLRSTNRHASEDEASVTTRRRLLINIATTACSTCSLYSTGSTTRVTVLDAETKLPPTVRLSKSFTPENTHFQKSRQKTLPAADTQKTPLKVPKESFKDGK